MIIHTELLQGAKWAKRYQGKKPAFCCVLGFTETALLPGISSAGATPESRRYTAVADAEYLINGWTENPTYPLPPLSEGASPVYISKAICSRLDLPIHLFNAGLPVTPSVPHGDLQGECAACVSTGKALPWEKVEYLFNEGMRWGRQLAQIYKNSYIIIGECVVAGTTTAQAVLQGLGIDSEGRIGSSLKSCNHHQKNLLVKEGLERSGLVNRSPEERDPFAVVAAVGDPMQIVVAGMAIAASQEVGVLLAGGTQMIAVFYLMQKIKDFYGTHWNNGQVIVGTTPWVVYDKGCDTLGLATAVPGLSLCSASINFGNSSLPQLLAYENGFVKEGVGAGGCAIAAYLMKDWCKETILQSVEAICSYSVK